MRAFGLLVLPYPHDTNIYIVKYYTLPVLFMLLVQPQYIFRLPLSTK